MSKSLFQIILYTFLRVLKIPLKFLNVNVIIGNLIALMPENIRMQFQLLLKNSLFYMPFV